MPHEKTFAPTSEGRRAHRRHEYTGRALVAHAGKAAAVPAVIVNLSETGCLLRLLSESDFELDDLVDLSIQSNDIAFRARARVRHVHQPESVIGVLFENLTTRGKADVQSLIQELEGSAENVSATVTARLPQTPSPRLGK